MEKLSKLFLICILFYSFQIKCQILKNNSVGISFGSLGVGLQVRNEFKENLNFRFSASFLQAKFEKNYTSSSILIDRSRKLRTGGISLVADWKFLKNTSFIWLTGGICYQFNQFNETRNFTLIETNEDLGNLDITIKTFPLNPYLGVLLGKHNSNRKLNCFIEVGTLFHGRPKVEFLGSGRVEPTADQDEIIRENLKNYNFYPNFNLQLNYKIN